MINETIKQKLRETRAYELIGDKIFKLRGQLFDWRYKVETAREVELSELEADSPNFVHGVKYAGTDPKSFAKLFSDWQINFEEFEFIDLGSGKGRVLLMASEYAFKKITGVEYSRELYEIARKNIENYRSPSQKCRRIESVNKDATLFAIPHDPLVFYIFNPFNAQVLKKVIKNIEQSLLQKPREIYFVYANPLHEEVLKNSEFFTLDYADPWYSIYKSKFV